MIKGVNLGGWLVLEKWIAPELFQGTDANDENDLYETLKEEEIGRRLADHRTNFIQERDFKWIADAGCNLVRLPVPYSIFGDVCGRIGCVEYVDQSFQWADKYGLKIMLDLHTVPGSQNGLDNGGVCGLCTWHLHPEYVHKTLDVLQRLAKRYGRKQALFGIEVLNEPIDEKTFKVSVSGLPERYKSNGILSKPVPTDFLKEFYMNAYEVVMPLLHETAKIIFHDGFRLAEWKDFMPHKDYPRVMFDTHMYLNFARYELQNQTQLDYISYIYKQFLLELQEAQTYHSVIVGEWTLAHRTTGMADLTENERKRYYQGSGCLQMMAYEITDGWVYFNYRVEDHTRIAWDFRKAITKQWLII